LAIASRLLLLFIEENCMSEINELAEKLKTEGEKFVGIFSGLTDEQWQTEIYTEGATWTIRDILSHFVTSEHGLVKLFERIRLGEGGVTDEFSIDRYNESQQQKTKDLTVAELLEKYKTTRGATVVWVLGLKETDLEIVGRHPFLETTTIREMVKMLYLHNQIHYRDLKKVLK
jgi:hypothetical protein